ncbi:hypothetical protein VTN00DRAFT_4765 [Thermoascus crustaceus]|uniref:uncharacterized protein n=1 Tax=Thermoascus crustaceus TaxID=5088 RepID=UPI003743041F
MPSILNTDLAGVADGSVLHLFYQDDQGNISEVYSEDGSTWKVSPTTVGTGAVNGTPITAYDVDKDTDYGQKQTIHVQYLATADNVNGVKLVEKVKVLPKGDWTSMGMPQNIENQTSQHDQALQRHLRPTWCLKTETKSQFTHLRRETKESYLLSIRLSYTEDPCISRLLSIPSNYTFAELHAAIQLAFGWMNTLKYVFNVFVNHEERTNKWFTIAAAADPLGYHRRTNCEDVTLAEVYDSEEYRGKEVKVVYEYDRDFRRDGDNWDHDISFLGRADPGMRKSLGLSGINRQSVIHVRKATVAPMLRKS